jgi:small-conductance mechanosensitive channel
MLSKLFMNDFYTNVANTLISILLLSIMYLIVYAIFSRKLHNPKKKQRFKIRLFYGVSFVFLFVVAKIWVEGFTHLLTFLILVSAALILANKELVMNLVGWLIINWRGVFSEGDYIRIQESSGYVYELGILAFKLFEESEHSPNRTSGRSIKIPNGFVINYPVINYSRQTNFLEYEQRWLLTYDTDPKKAEAFFLSIAKKLLKKFYAEHKDYSVNRLKRRHRLLAHLMDLEVHVYSHLKMTEPYGLEVVFSYYCYPKDYNEIDYAIREEIFKKLKKQTNIKLMEPENV